MGSRVVPAAVILLACLTSAAPAAKYAGESYHIGVGARALGRGGAFVAARPDASSAFWNIAATAAISEVEIMAQHAEAFGTLLNHDFVAVALPAKGETGWAFGFYGTYLGGGGIQLTEFDSLRGRPVVTGEENHADWSLSAGIARKTGRWWSWGAAAKIVVRDLPGNAAYGLGMDAGLRAGGRGWRAGIKLADITTTFLAYDSGRKETITPHINWGGEYELPELTDGLRTVFAAEAETYFEGRKTGAQYWSGNVSVDLHLGFEATFRDVFSGRVGSDAGRLALGAGFVAGRWGVDASLTDHDFLDNSYRVALRYIMR